MTGKIALEGLIFHAFHGVHAHETTSGNRFEIDLIFEFDVSAAADSDKLEDTVDYEQVYKVVRREMELPAHLLEHLAERIVSALLDTFSPIRYIQLKLSKLNPPVGGMCNKASLLVEKRRA